MMYRSMSGHSLLLPFWGQAGFFFDVGNQELPIVEPS